MHSKLGLAIIAIIFSFLGVAAAVYVGMNFDQPHGWVFGGVTFGGLYCLGMSYRVSDRYYEKAHANDIILRELDSKTPYFVLFRAERGGNNILFLQNVATNENRWAVVSGVYPPDGFREITNSHGNIAITPKDNIFIDLAFGKEKESRFPDISYEDTV